MPPHADLVRQCLTTISSRHHRQRLDRYALSAALPNLGCEIRGKPLPPEPHRRVADINAALMQQVFNTPDQKRVPDVQDHSQAGDLKTRFEVAEGTALRHVRKLPSAESDFETSFFKRADNRHIDPLRSTHILVLQFWKIGEFLAMASQIRVNGVNLAYRVDGSDEKETVVLSNSLMSTHRMWDPQMRELRKNYRVVRYDTRGHGQSETTSGPYDMEQLAEDAHQLIVGLGLGPVHFVGLSMGGMIAQRLAVRHPEVVKSISLCDTASHMPPREMWDERIDIANEHGIEGHVDTTIKRWFRPNFIQSSPGAVGFVEQMILETGVDGYVACASAIRDMHQTELLPKISAPTLILLGRQDPACTYEQAMVMKEKIPHAEFHAIEDAAHLSNIEKPAEFNSVLLSFLDRNSG